MGRNLGPLNIKDSYEGLVQISGSDQLTDGSGSLIERLNVTSSFATTATSASQAVNADNALTAISASHAVNSDTAISASFATTASYAINASASTLQEVLDQGNTATQDINLTGDINAINVTASYASFTSASIGFLETITGSAVIIGDEFVVLNANTPAVRYSGIQVYDSGSVPAATASFEWDGHQDIWIQVDESGQSSTMLTGEKGTKGSESFPTANTLQKGNGDATLSDSSITDDGTLVTINANVSASGYVSASSFIGDGSQLENLPSSDPFPYTGSAEITGSLGVTGSFSVEDNTIGGTELFAALGTTLAANNGNVELGGVGNNLSSTSWGRVVIGGRSNQLTGGSSVGIFGGFTNSITGGEDNAIVTGRSNTISGGGEYRFIGGGRGNNLNGSSNYSAIVGGQNNTVSNGQKSIILGGDSHSIGNNLRSFIVGGESGTVNGGQGGGVLGGINGTNSHNFSVVLGGANLSTSKDGEAVVNHLSTYGAVVQDVDALTITSNTASLDASDGNMFTLTLQNAADTHLTISNQSAGQTFSLKITNDATAAGTISFGPGFEFEDGTAFEATAATSAVDILTFTTFDGTSVQCVGAKNFS